MKKIILILTFLVSLTCFSSIAFASDTLPNFSEYIKNDDGSEKYYVISSEDYHDSSWDTKYYLYVMSGQPSQVSFSTNSMIGYRVGSYMDYCAVYTYIPGTDDTWQFSRGGTDGAIEIRYGHLLEEKQGRSLHYTNFDVISTDGTKVFHRAPMIMGAILPQMKILTLVFSSVIYLIPCLVSLVVLVISFRKAWNWLLSQLLT